MEPPTRRHSTKHSPTTRPKTPITATTHTLARYLDPTTSASTSLCATPTCFGLFCFLVLFILIPKITRCFICILYRTSGKETTRTVFTGMTSRSTMPHRTTRLDDFSLTNNHHNQGLLHVFGSTVDPLSTGFIIHSARATWSRGVKNHYPYSLYDPLRTSIVGFRWQPGRCKIRLADHDLTSPFGDPSLCSSAFASCLCHSFGFLCTTMGYHEVATGKENKNPCVSASRSSPSSQLLGLE